MGVDIFFVISGYLIMGLLRENSKIAAKSICCDFMGGDLAGSCRPRFS